jgi:AraC family transcriptional regulator
MQPRIESLQEKKLVGIRSTMSFANNQTFKLWQSFMPRRNEIKNKISSDFFSIQIFPSNFKFTTPELNAMFEKWAAIEVTDFEVVPAEMETLVLNNGLYAVFDYKGLSTDNSIFRYIFGTWLPRSETYLLDDRPHFEVLGEKYKNNDPDSEEEIWIPIKTR